ncbi:MAG: TetR/AcrR family transcriptional regulator [Firmicutes bacterium]|nr:TetR/AcrR family transcriptional regulator [Bacillota bacterium]MBO2522061.1 TetR/AcrR family transcriptional regulator [Bacillota bacterium]
MDQRPSGRRRGRRGSPSRPGPSQERANAQETRRAILDAAVELFTEKGYCDFSLRQVARATGYTPTTVYLYFKDKDDLLFHVAMEGFRHFASELERAAASGATPLERLLAIGRAYVRFGLDHPLHYRLMFMERDEFLQREPPPGFTAPMRAFELLVQTVAECVEGGYFRPGDSRAYAIAIWSTVHGLVSLALTNPSLDREQVTAIEEVAYRMIQHGLLP